MGLGLELRGSTVDLHSAHYTMLTRIAEAILQELCKRRVEEGGDVRGEIVASFLRSTFLRRYLEGLRTSVANAWGRGSYPKR